jgi:hypothetical protein
MRGLGVFRVFWEKIWAGLFLIIAVIAAAFQAGHAFLEGDTFWHIKTGQWILENRVIPLHDPFSWSANGNPWTAHEWLWDLAAGWAWNTAGKWGLWALMLIGIALFAFALWLILRRISTPLTASVLTGVVLIIVPTFWCARPHVLATGLFAVWIALLIFGRERPGILYWLIPVAVLWANVHSSVLLGVGFIIVALLCGFLEKDSPKYRRTLLLVFGISLLAVCLTPQGIKIYSYVVQVTSHSGMMNYISEWQSPNFHNTYMLPFLIMIGIVICLLLLKPRQVSLFHGFLVAITLIMSLLQVRQAPLFYFSAVILIADQLPWNQRTTPKSIDLLSVVLVAGLIFTAWPLQVSWTESPREGQAYPERALEYIKEHGYTERIFNDYSWGGYLIFHDLQPFVDGRADMYVLSGTSVFQDYLQLMRGSLNNPLQILDNYQVEVVLIPPDRSLRWALEHAPNWRKAYFSYPAVVFVRE